MVAELWVRTIREFHEELLSAAATAAPGIDKALTVAGTIVDFASRRPQDARLMLVASRTELIDDPSIGPDLAATLDRLNDPADALARKLARELYGRATASGLDRVVIGVYGLPYTAVRRRLLQDKDPKQLKPLVLKAARAVLEA